MNFDFTNYTFNFLASIVIAILGIGYPLFLENVRKIDEQYKSSHLMKRFKGEGIFKLYQVSLIGSVFISFISPFIMLQFNCTALNIVIESIHGLGALLLVFSVLKMYPIILVYYDPTELSHKLCDKNKEEEIFCVADLMNYASCRENRAVYDLCKSYLSYLVIKEQKKHENESYNISQDLKVVLIRLINYSKDKKSLYLYNDNLLVQCFYNWAMKCYNGPLNYQTLWNGLYQMMDTDNTEWIRQYWSYAVQYYSLFIEHDLFEKEDSKSKENDILFKEMNLMVGVMMVDCAKYDWLRFIMFHSAFNPPKYPLIPSTFTQIIDEAEALEVQLGKPWRLTSKYQLLGKFADVNSDDIIMSAAYKYLGLLFIRLFSVDDYNITYNDPMEVNNPEGDYIQLETKKKIAQYLKMGIGYWYIDNRIDEINLPKLPDQTESQSLLDKYIKYIDDKIEYNLQNPEFDKDKMLKLKSLLAECDDKYEIESTIYPTQADKTDMKPNTLMISVENKPDKYLVSKKFNGWSNYPDVLYKLLVSKINNYFDGLFLVISPSQSYKIKDNHIFIALEKLCLNENYVILSMGVNLDTLDVIYNQEEHKMSYDEKKDESKYNDDIQVIARASGQQSLLIMPKSSVPKIEFVKPDEKFQKRGLIKLKEDKDDSLCTNIDDIIKNNSVDFVIEIAKHVKSYFPNSFNFIRIQVIQDGDDDYDLKRIVPVTEK